MGGTGTTEQDGRFAVEGVLGRGQLAEVLAVVDPSGRPRALKVLRPEHLADAGMREHLFTEARALARLHHPSIVALEQVVRFHRRPALVLERLRGVCLRALGPRVPLELARRILVQLAQALAAAHAQGVLHRDVTVDNVIVEPGAQPGSLEGLRTVLIDFGTAAIADGRRPDLAPVGTPEYRAPEAWRGRAEPRSDVYSLGVLAFRLVTGRLPFPSASVPTLRRWHEERSPRPAHELRPGLPAAWSQAIACALAKAPEDRFRSPLGFAEALAQPELGAAPSAPAGRSPSPATPPATTPPADVQVGVLNAQGRRLYEARAFASSPGRLFVITGARPALGTELALALAEGARVDGDVLRVVGPEEAEAFGGACGFELRVHARSQGGLAENRYPIWT